MTTHSQGDDFLNGTQIDTMMTQWHWKARSAWVPYCQDIMFFNNRMGKFVARMQGFIWNQNCIKHWFTFVYLTANLAFLVALLTLSVMVWSLWSLQAQHELSPSPFLPSSQARHPVRGLNTTSLRNSSVVSTIVGSDGFDLALSFLLVPFLFEDLGFDTVFRLTEVFFDNSLGLLGLAILWTDFFLSTFTAPVFSGFKGAVFIQTRILLLESSWLSDVTGFLVLLLFLFKGLFIFFALILCSTIFSLTLVIVSRMNDKFLTESLRIVSPFPMSNFPTAPNFVNLFSSCFC